MYIKKILATVALVATVAVSAAMFAAYEAYVINVTAHIENSLRVHPNAIEFGTVFPQEYVERDITVELSDSFVEEERVDDVMYVIKQKPKPIWEEPTECGQDFEDIDEARAYCHDNPDDLDCCYLSLCPYLSKLDGDPDDGNDEGVPSYYVKDTAGDYCETPSPEYASGYLSKDDGDTLDIWTIDLKVPPVEGTVGQDWPEGCPTVAENDKDYGCDLWIEVIGISEEPI